MGPHEARVPTTRLKKLSPLTDPAGHAARRRARCEAFAAIPTFTAGDVIRLGIPITLSNGRRHTSVRRDSYRHRGRNYRFYHCVETGEGCRLSKGQLAGAVLVGAAAPLATSVLAEFAIRKAAAPH